jgi:hypothetical protein
VAIAGYTITSTGGLIASYSISPAKPAGTLFSTSTGLLTGVPTTVQAATDYTITATNATSTASRTFTLTVTVTAPAFTLSSYSESKVQNVAIAGYTITSTGGLIASYSISPAAPLGTSFSTSTGLLSGTPPTVPGATVYTITATNATGTATQTFRLTVTLSTCAQDGSCVVGVDRGPGGGIVFYAAVGTFASPGSDCNTAGVGGISTCKYLEAAPTTGSSAWTDVTRTWATGFYAGVDAEEEPIAGGNWIALVSGADGTAIGTGYQNTLDIVAQTGNVAATSAAVAAREYRGPNNLFDWFLPSKLELQKMFVYRTAIGVTDSSNYWSSSEVNSYQSSSYFYISSSLYGYNTVNKSSAAYFRPVRAF